MDLATNSILRVELHRLREKLRCCYLSSGARQGRAAKRECKARNASGPLRGRDGVNCQKSFGLREGPAFVAHVGSTARPLASASGIPFWVSWFAFNPARSVWLIYNSCSLIPQPASVRQDLSTLPEQGLLPLLERLDCQWHLHVNVQSSPLKIKRLPSQ